MCLVLTQIVNEFDFKDCERLGSDQIVDLLPFTTPITFPFSVFPMNGLFFERERMFFASKT